LFASRRDDTLKLRDHLAHKQRDASEDATTFARLVPRVVLSGICHGSFAHREVLRLWGLIEHTGKPCTAGQEGLEPPTVGFGDRCATNCATALQERWDLLKR